MISLLGTGANDLWTLRRSTRCSAQGCRIFLYLPRCSSFGVAVVARRSGRSSPQIVSLVTATAAPISARRPLPTARPRSAANRSCDAQTKPRVAGTM